MKKRSETVPYLGLTYCFAHPTHATVKVAKVLCSQVGPCGLNLILGSICVLVCIVDAIVEYQVWVIVGSRKV